MAEIMSQSRQKEIAQEKREHGLEIAPAANQQTREERAQGRQDQERGRQA
jgi:hypothetical protein